MDNVNKSTESLWDVFLFPVWVHKKISISLKSLLPAFLFVGLFDITFSQNVFKTGIFSGDVLEVFGKLLFFLVLSLAIGTIDVICTIIPIAEFAVMIGKRSEKYVSSRMPVILMKSYSISHILFIIPTAVYVYSGIDWLNVNMASANSVRLVFSMIMVLMSFLPFIQLGFIYRTISVRTRLQVFEKLILILTTYFWMQLSGAVIVYLESVLNRIIERLG